MLRWIDNGRTNDTNVILEYIDDEHFLIKNEQTMQYLSGTENNVSVFWASKFFVPITVYEVFRSTSGYVTTFNGMWIRSNNNVFCQVNPDECISTLKIEECVTIVCQTNSGVICISDDEPDLPLPIDTGTTTLPPPAPPSLHIDTDTTTLPPPAPPSLHIDTDTTTLPPPAPPSLPIDADTTTLPPPAPPSLLSDTESDNEMNSFGIELERALETFNSSKNFDTSTIKRGPGRPKGSRNNTDKPKRIRTAGQLAFAAFQKDHRNRLKKKYPDLTFSDISTKLGKKWKNLSRDEREYYFS